MSPFDPMAMLDEIQRLVPGYDVSRLNLLAGNDEHTTALAEQGRRQRADDPSTGSCPRTIRCLPPARWAAIRRR